MRISWLSDQPKPPAALRRLRVDWQHIAPGGRAAASSGRTRSSDLILWDTRVPGPKEPVDLRIPLVAWSEDASLAAPPEDSAAWCLLTPDTPGGPGRILRMLGGFRQRRLSRHPARARVGIALIETPQKIQRVEADFRRWTQADRLRQVPADTVGSDLRVPRLIPGPKGWTAYLPLPTAPGWLKFDWDTLPGTPGLAGWLDVLLALVPDRRLPSGRFQAATTAGFERFFDTVGDGLIIADRHAVIQSVNRPLCRWLNLPEHTLVGCGVYEFVHPDDRQGLAAWVLRLQQGDFGSRRFPVRLLRDDGSAHPFEVSVDQLPGMGGTVVVVLRDLSDLHELNRRLAEANLYLENVIESSPDAIIAADLQGRITLFNPSAQALTGWKAEHLRKRGQGIEQFYPLAEARRVMQAMRENVAGGGAGIVRNIRTELIARDGQRIPIVIHAALLRNEQGEISGSVGIFTDLRQLVAMEQALEETRQQLIQSERDAAVADLAGATAHHLNQPLTAIVGYLDILRKRHPELADETALARISESATQMARIVREIGRVTRFETRRYADGGSILALDAALSDSAGDES